MRSDPAIRSLFLVLGALLAAPSMTQDPAPSDGPPAESGLEEEVGVQLVLVDAVVVDRANRTVPDLTADDFRIVVDGTIVSLDTLDVACEGGAVDEPVSVRSPARRARLVPPDQGRKLVLLFDYLHMNQLRRAEVLGHARRMIRHGMTSKDEVMLAALAGGLRVEQAFTSDVDRLVDSLNRMEYDISLWGQNFAHLTEEPFFAGLEAILEVLVSVSGSKAVVLFSDSPGRADENDPDFARVTALASAARCSFHPVHASGLITPG